MSSQNTFFPNSSNILILCTWEATLSCYLGWYGNLSGKWEVPLSVCFTNFLRCKDIKFPVNNNFTHQPNWKSWWKHFFLFLDTKWSVLYLASIFFSWRLECSFLKILIMKSNYQILIFILDLCTNFSRLHPFFFC